MIHLSLSAGRPPDVSPEEFDDYFRSRHLGFAKRLEGVRLLSATRVVRFHSADGRAIPAWVLDAWWDDGDALTRCFRSYGGLALLGDRMTMMADPLPGLADVTEQVRHGSARDALFDPGIGPRVRSGRTKLHLLVPPDRERDLDAVVEALGTKWPHEGSPIAAYSVSRGTGRAYPLNNVLAGVDPPTLPSAPSRGSAIELWLHPAFDLDLAAAGLGPLGGLLDDPEVTWWLGESRDVFMSLPVASFLALDPVGAGR